MKVENLDTPGHVRIIIPAKDHTTIVIDLTPASLCELCDSLRPYYDYCYNIANNIIP